MNKFILKYLVLLICLLVLGTMLYDIGFSQKAHILVLIHQLYFACLLAIIVAVPVRHIIHSGNLRKMRIWIIDLVLWFFYIYLIFRIDFSELSKGNVLHGIHGKIWLFLAFFISLLRELSVMKLDWRYKHTNPAAIFVISFTLLIFGGTLLLTLPRATFTGISFIDALFTSTSAVCVTGLIVVDTGTYFTFFGQLIILVLFQLGGIGIMTFTSFFSYFFMGGSSYKNLIMLGNLTNEKKISEVIGTLKKILFFTFLIEFAGVLLIYINIRSGYAMNQPETVFFSIFHAVSAFCNAGFATVSDSFYHIDFRYNYFLHVTIACVFIIGGLGFPVIINVYTWLKHLLINGYLSLFRIRRIRYRAQVFSLNSKLVIYTTLILLFVGTLVFYLTEYNNTLSDHQGLGKLIAAFFSAATPRTAGFNMVDTGAIRIPTLMFIILLMWIGASPASTGGGIKTSTLALALLNVISLARGRDKVELYRRQIHDASLRRAFAFMFLSLIIIGFVISLLFITEPDKFATDIIFEVFSAFSTVGLSRGITGDLSDAGKYIIVFTMFIGRVGALTILVAVIKKSTGKFIQYPSEGILIN
ncbi:MAG: potassium transporter TrkG [Bacteroidales bacterium]|nr:potassium transporter TrkG [Bacteroidales bacterium]MDT8430105.1 potassium transporter TrkG [Bacteroidales bacterium]